MELRHIETFLAIVDAGTLTAAADRLYKTQAAVSHDLRSLERELNLSLIDRTGQRIVLTAAGRALLPHSRALVGAIAEIDLAMERERTGDAGVVRIGALPSLAGGLVDYLVAYREIVPDARFVVLTEPQAHLCQGIRAGRLDLALAEVEIGDEIESAVLGVEQLVLVTRRDSPLAGRAKVGPSDVEGAPFVGCIRELGSSRPAERFFSASGTFPRAVIEVQDPWVMRDLIRRGVGYGLMTTTTHGADIDDELIALRTEPDISRHVALLTRANRIAPAAVSQFHTYLVEHWRGARVEPRGRGRSVLRRVS